MTKFVCVAVGVGVCMWGCMRVCRGVHFSLPLLLVHALALALCDSVYVLTKLPLSSQWATRWPPQDSASVDVAITRRGGFGLGMWTCFNAKHRWVAPWACCCGPPSAASSGCRTSKLIRLTITRTLISSLSFFAYDSLFEWLFTVCHFLSQCHLSNQPPSLPLSRSVLLQKIQYTGVFGTCRLVASLERNVFSFEHWPVTEEIVPCRKKIVDQKLANKRTLVTGKKIQSAARRWYTDAMTY